MKNILKFEIKVPSDSSFHEWSYACVFFLMGILMVTDDPLKFFFIFTFGIFLNPVLILAIFYDNDRNSVGSSTRN